MIDGSSEYWTLGSEISNVSAPRGLKPGFTCCKRAKLFSRSPALLSRTSASATSAMTRPLRKRLRPVPCVELRPPSLSASVSSGRALARPGTRPKIIPVPTAIASVTPNTPRSTFTSRKRGTVCAPIIFNNSTPHNARRTPATPPISARLALIGGVAGVLLALWGVELLKIIGAQTVPRLREVNVDLGVLGVTLAIAVGTGIIFGLVPALASARPELTEALKEGGRSSMQGRGRNRLRSGLVIAEVALALVLLSGAGLLMKSFARLQHVNPGFNPRNALTFEVSLPKIQYPDNPSIVRFNNEAQRRIAALPGVQAAGFSTILPLAGTNSDWSFAIEGRPSNRNSPSPDEEKRQVSSDYFRALETPLIKGRLFTDADTADAPRVMLVNQAFVKKFCPTEDALGKRITFDNPKKNPKWITIVGVVGDIRHFGL